MDNTVIHPASQSLAHLIDLFVFKGAPQNTDPDHEVQILVNHGYVVGYSPHRLQPLWAAYRVAHADQDVDFDRPHLYYADQRLDKEVRLAAETFGRHDNIAYHVGHMVPQEVINRQFGRLAQMETFFMSNMSPQQGSLNTGTWQKLENMIRKIEDMPNQRDHVWAVSGPVFGDNPKTILRSGGQEIPIPDAYYSITVDPFRFPWDEMRNVDVACFLIPQDTPGGSTLTDFLVDLEDIESATGLVFFPGWNRTIGLEAVTGGAVEPAPEGTPQTRHRLLRQLNP